MGIEKNIEALSALRLVGLEYALRFHIFWGGPGFTLQHREVREGDTLQVLVFFQKKENALEYDLAWYDLTLKKKIVVPAGIIEGLDSVELEEKMKAVNWNVDFLKAPATSDLGISPEELKHIGEILTELRTFAQSVEGALPAEHLKMKFWLDTPMEVFIEKLSGSKNYEVSQRFYLFEGEEMITLDEAYCILCHRRRLRAGRLLIKGVRLPVQKSEYK